MHEANSDDTHQVLVAVVVVLAMSKNAAKKKRKRQASSRHSSNLASLKIPSEVESQIQAAVSKCFEEELDADSIAAVFRDELQLPHVSSTSIEQYVHDDKSLADLARRMYGQTEKARKVFQLLDGAGKGVIVVEDLQRVVNEFLDEDLDADDLFEMIDVVDQSGNGLLSQDDLVQVARLIGL